MVCCMVFWGVFVVFLLLFLLDWCVCGFVFWYVLLGVFGVDIVVDMVVCDGVVVIILFIVFDWVSCVLVGMGVVVVMCDGKYLF